MININKNSRAQASNVAWLLILVGVISRFLPHPYNFTPVAAIAIFSGAHFSKKTALILPMVIMFLSDIFLGFYHIGVMVSVYGSFFACTILGFWLKKHQRWYTVAGSSLFASLLFFIVTNFAFWMFTPLYEKTLAGLMTSYLMGLPFFRNTLLGDLFYVSALFGVYEIVIYRIGKKWQEARDTLLQNKHEQSSICISK